MDVRGVDGGVEVGVGKKGLGVCTMKAPLELPGVKGIITQTLGKGRYIAEKKSSGLEKEGHIKHNVRHA